MADAQCDGGRYWTARFRGLNHERRRVRVPSAHLDGFADPGPEAARWALESELLCQRIEAAAASGHVDDDALRSALVRKAITPAQAAALRGGEMPPPAAPTPEAWTITEAAHAHPASQREHRSLRSHWIEHSRWVDRFCAFAGVRLIADLRLDQVQRWIEKMKADGYAWSTRQHALRFLRRASRMASTEGLPDVLTGLRIDHREMVPRPRVHQLEQLARLLIEISDPRWRLVVALGGLVGLRPSEIIRMRCGDAERDGDADVAYVGGIDGLVPVKTASSRRALPLPAFVGALWRQVRGRRPAGDRLLVTASPRHSAQPFTAETFGQRWRQIVGDDALTPKALRKSFATWSLRAIGVDHMEAFMGHASAMATAVSRAHYLGAWMVDELRPAAATIDRTIRAALAAAAAPRSLVDLGRAPPVRTIAPAKRAQPKPSRGARRRQSGHKARTQSA